MRGGFDFPFETSNLDHCAYPAYRKKKGEKKVIKEIEKNVRKCEDESIRGEVKQMDSND